MAGTRTAACTMCGCGPRTFPIRFWTCPLRALCSIEHDSLGIFIANHGGGYRHPTAEKHLRPPTHYAAAPLIEWKISATGALVPPLGMTEYVGDKPEHARRHQLAMHWEAVAREPRPTAAPPPQPRVVLPEKHAPSGGYETRVDLVEQQRINEAIARIFNRER